MSPASRCFPVVLLAILGLTACEQPSTPPDNHPEFGSLSGLVLDQETELPIADAAVMALKNAVADTTDSLGAFLLDSLALGTDTIMVTLALYDTKYSTISIHEGPQQDTIYLHPTDTTVIPNPTPGEWLLLGLESESITTIVVDPIDEYVIYAGSGSDFSAGKVGGLFKSTDGGAAWDTLIRGITVRDIDIHPFDHQVLYVTAGINFLTPWGILKTKDGGMSWARADTGLHLWPEEGPGVLAINPMYPDTLYLGTGGVMGGNLYKSTNGGQTWEAIGTDVHYLIDGVTAIAIDPFNTDIIYVGTPGIGAIFKSTDGGASWERMDFPEVGIINDLLVHPVHPETIYAGIWGSPAGEVGGFYFSTNRGTTWQTANDGLMDTNQVLGIDISHTQIYIAVSFRDTGAVYTSYQDQIIWNVVGGRGFDQRIESVSYAPALETLFMGSKGIYMLSDPINHENNP